MNPSESWISDLNALPNSVESLVAFNIHMAKIFSSIKIGVPVQDRKETKVRGLSSSFLRWYVFREKDVKERIPSPLTWALIITFYDMQSI